MVGLARSLGGPAAWDALCHPEPPASQRVLAKCGFQRAQLLRGEVEFPNLRPGEQGDAVRAAWRGFLRLRSALVPAGGGSAPAGAPAQPGGGSG
jgi:hypothetical protein